MRPVKLVPENTNIPFLSYRWWALAMSILLLTSSVALVAVRGRKPTSEAFAVVVGAGAKTQTISWEFDIPDRHREKVDRIAQELGAKLRSEGLRTELLLAILGRTCLGITQNEKEKEHG